MADTSPRPPAGIKSDVAGLKRYYAINLPGWDMKTQNSFNASILEILTSIAVGMQERKCNCTPDNCCTPSAKTGQDNEIRKGESVAQKDSTPEVSSTLPDSKLAALSNLWNNLPESSLSSLIPSPASKTNPPVTPTPPPAPDFAALTKRFTEDPQYIYRVHAREALTKYSPETGFTALLSVPETPSKYPGFTIAAKNHLKWGSSSSPSPLISTTSDLVRAISIALRYEQQEKSEILVVAIDKTRLPADHVWNAHTLVNNILAKTEILVWQVIPKEAFVGIIDWSELRKKDSLGTQLPDILGIKDPYVSVMKVREGIDGRLLKAVILPMETGGKIAELIVNELSMSVDSEWTIFFLGVLIGWWFGVRVEVGMDCSTGWTRKSGFGRGSTALTMLHGQEGVKGVWRALQDVKVGLKNTRTRTVVNNKTYTAIASFGGESTSFKTSTPETPISSKLTHKPADTLLFGSPPSAPIPSPVFGNTESKPLAALSELEASFAELRPTQEEQLARLKPLLNEKPWTRPAFLGTASGDASNSKTATTSFGQGAAKKSSSSASRPAFGLPEVDKSGPKANSSIKTLPFGQTNPRSSAPDSSKVQFGNPVHSTFGGSTANFTSSAEPPTGLPVFGQPSKTSASSVSQMTSIDFRPFGATGPANSTSKADQASSSQPSTDASTVMANALPFGASLSASDVSKLKETTKPAFGTPIGNGQAATSSPLAFGAAGTSTGFGSTTASRGFGSFDSSAGSCGSSAFGSSTAVGQAISPQPSAFGASGSSNISGFGSSATFGKPSVISATSAFGTANPPPFRSGSSSGFGASAPFGQSTSPSSAFGSSNPFGSPSALGHSTSAKNSPSVLKKQATSVSEPPKFGDSATFGSSSAFGAASVSNPSPVTSASSVLFGQATPSTFGSFIPAMPSSASKTDSSITPTLTSPRESRPFPPAPVYGPSLPTVTSSSSQAEPSATRTSTRFPDFKPFTPAPVFDHLPYSVIEESVQTREMIQRDLDGSQKRLEEAMAKLGLQKPKPEEETVKQSP